MRSKDEKYVRCIFEIEYRRLVDGQEMRFKHKARPFDFGGLGRRLAGIYRRRH